jgi:hypothetical protein
MPLEWIQEGAYRPLGEFRFRLACADRVVGPLGCVNSNSLFVAQRVEVRQFESRPKVIVTGLLHRCLLTLRGWTSPVAVTRCAAELRWRRYPEGGGADPQQRYAIRLSSGLDSARSQWVPWDPAGSLAAGQV